jgi:uncharacterized repeat protein (TIGR01451 family)
MTRPWRAAAAAAALTLLVVLAPSLPAAATAAADPFSTSDAFAQAASSTDLVIRVASASPARSGQAATFDVTVSNVGGTAAGGGVSVELSAPSGAAGSPTASGSGWVCSGTTCSSSSVVSAGGSLPSLTVSVPVQPTVGGSLRLTATLTAPSDAVAGNNTSSVQVPVVAGATYDLGIAVSPTGGAVAGAVATFSVTISNLGSTQAPAPTRVRLSPYGSIGGGQVIPTGTGWVCPGDATECTYSTAIAAGANAPTLTVKVPVAAGSLSSSVSLTASLVNPGDSVSADDSATASTPSVRSGSADLAVAVSTSAPAVAAGTAAFQVTVRNLGGSAAPGAVQVRLSTSGSLGSGTFSASGTGWSCPGGGPDCLVAGPLAPGSSLAVLTVLVPVAADPGSATSVRLSASLVGNVEDVHDNDYGSASVPVVAGSSADLAVSASAASPAAYNGAAEFAVRLRNVGNSTAAGPVHVTVRGGGPLASSTVSGTGTGWTCPGDGSDCVYSGDLAAGASAPDLTVSLAVGDDPAAPRTVYLTAGIASGDPGPLVNNSTTATVPVSGSLATDLAVTAAGPGPVASGATASVVLTARNVGTASASGAVTLQVSSDLGPLTLSGSGWVCSSGGSCDHAGPVAAGASLPALTATAVTSSVNSGASRSLTATVSSAADLGLANDTAVAGIGVGGTGADLVPVVGAPAPVAPGATATYPVSVVNAGSLSSSGRVTVTLSAPSGASAHGSGWTCSSTLVCETTAAIAAGATRSGLSVDVSVPKADSVGSIAVSAAVSGGVDSRTGNNGADATSSTGIAAVDLVPVASIGAPVVAGGAVAGSVVVRNTGTSASAAAITVQLSIGGRGAVAAGAGWVCSSDLVCSTTSAVAAGAATSPITVQSTSLVTDALGTISLYAHVESPSDGWTRNDDAAASTTVGGIPRDLAVRLLGGDPFVGGSVSHLSVEVVNAGTSPVTDTVTLQLYSPYPDASATGPDWTCDATLACTTDADVAARGSLPVLDLAIRPPAGTPAGTATATAQVSGSETIGSNDASWATLPVAPQAGAAALVTELTRQHSGVVSVGSDEQFTVTVTNRSAADVGAPAVTLAPSFGLTVSQVAGTGWACVQLSCTYPIGFAPGQSSTLLVSGTITDAAVSRSFLTATTSWPTPTAATSSQTIALVVADRGLDLVPVVSSGQPSVAGGAATFRVSVRNLGGDAAGKPTEVALSVSGPTTGPPTSTGAGWSCASGTSRCATKARIQPQGAAPDLLVSVPVSTDATSGRVILSARVTNASDSVPADDYASASVPVVSSANDDLAVSVSGATSAYPGASAGFDVAVRNVGGGDHPEDVRINLTSTGYVASPALGTSGIGWSCVADGHQCVLPGGLDQGTSAPVLRVSAAVSTPFSQSRYVGVRAALVAPDDSSRANDTATADVPVGLPSSADLAVSAWPTSDAISGGTAAFVVRVRNVARVDAGSPVRLRLSASGAASGAVISAGGTGWSCALDAGQCVTDSGVTAGSVVPDLVVSVPVSRGLTTPGAVGLTVSLLGADVVPENDTAYASAALVAAAPTDLALSMSPSGLAVPGSSADVTVTVSNLGYSSAPGPIRVALSANGDADGSRLTATGTGWSCPGDGRECVNSSGLAAGASLPALVVHVPVSPTPSSRWLSLYGSLVGAPDDLGSNDAGQVVVPVRAAAASPDLALATTASAPARLGGSLSFVTTVTNLAAVASSQDVTVTMSLHGPGVASAGSGWSCSAESCVHVGGVAGNGALPPITTTVAVPTADAFRTWVAGASLSAADDSVAANNYAAAVSSSGGVAGDLVPRVVASQPSRMGTTLSYSVGVHNAGGASATGPISVQLSAPVTGTTASGDGWVCSLSLTCTNSTPVAAGADSSVLTVTLPVSSKDDIGSRTLYAAVSAESDSVSLNATSQATGSTGGVAADLVPRLSAQEPANQGDTVHYTATLTNSGEASTSGTSTLQLSLPASGGVASGTGWICSASLICDYTGSLAAHETAPPVDVRFTSPSADHSQSWSGSAWATGGGESLTGNNSATATTGTGGSPLDVVARIGGATVLVAGTRSTLTATVQNRGSETLQDPVSLTVGAPSGSSVGGDGWVCTSGLVCQHAAPLDAGAELPPLSIDVPTAAEARQTSATVSVRVSAPGDRNTANDADDVTLPVAQVLAGGGLGSNYLGLTPAVDTTFPGGVAELDIQLHGAAPFAGQQATLALTLPTGVTYRAGSATGIPEPLSSTSFLLTMPGDGATLNARLSLDVGTAFSSPSATVGAQLSNAAGDTDIRSVTFRVVAPTLGAVTPTTIGRGRVSLVVTGGLLDPSFPVTLRRSGSPTLTATSQTGGLGRVEAEFDTTGAAPGQYDVIVAPPSGAPLRIDGGVTITATTVTAVAVDISGPGRVRLNQAGNYYATVTNTGNVDAYDVPVLLTVPTGVDAQVVAPESNAIVANVIDGMTSSSGALGTLTPQIAAEIKAQLVSTPPEAAVPDPVKPVSYVMSYIGYLPAGKSATATFAVTPRARVTADVTASVPVDTAYFASTQRVSNLDRRMTVPATGNVTSVDEGVAAICSDPVFADVCPTVRGYTNGIKVAQKLAYDNACISFAGMTKGYGTNSCGVTAPWVSHPDKAVQWAIEKKFPWITPYTSFGRRVWGTLTFAKGIFDSLIGAADDIEKGYEDVQFGVASVDPNELLGNAGVGPQRFVKPTQKLTYTIEFENVATAEAPAQRVTLLDALPSAIDPTSVTVVGAEVSGHEIPLVDASSESVNGVTGATDLTDTTSVLLDAAVDRTTGVLTAHFAGPPDLDDPFTPSPYSDFLPPNVVAGEGQGSLRIEAMLKQPVADGAAVTNQASVVFDDHLGGPTIVTNTWTNTVDAGAPSAQLEALPQVSYNRARLHWTASDSGSGASGAQVLRSVDGGPLTLASIFAPGTSAELPVASGHTYGFAIRPVDGVGNVGPVSATVTTIGVTASPPDAPAQVVASPLNGGARISWAAPAADGGVPISTYTATASPGGASCSAGATARSCDIAGLTNGISYTVTVTAGSAAGTSPSSAGVSVTPDGTLPSVSITSIPSVTLSSSVPVRWSGADASAVVYNVQLRSTTYSGTLGAWTSPQALQGTAGTSTTVAVAAGSTVCARAQARDAAGNVSAWTAQQCTTRALDDRSLVAGKGWKRVTGSAFYLKTATSSSTKAASLTLKSARFTRIGLVASTCARCGTVGVYLGKALLAKVNLAGKPTARRIFLLAGVKARSGSIVVRVLSKKKTVQVDGLVLIKS